MKAVKVISTVLLASTLYGCAATQVALEKKDLDVQTQMSDTIFLDPVSASKKTVFIQIRNTSDRQQLQITDAISSNIQSKGYKLLDDPDAAHYLLQVNILQAGKTDPAAAERALAGGYGSVVVGAAAGYAVGGSGTAATAGGLLFGAAELVANSLVKDVTYSLITDIQLSERAKGSVSSNSAHSLKQGNSGSTQVQYSEVGERKKYQTRVVSTANKVNLKFEEALPELKKGLSNSISGLL
ncbi:complement resistance protein TraT [Endozoicomonas acroporae]|uniref:complement resistance protein TraT n=2 Tax=Endozoicomonas TaxID=305899 RepID=UPI000C7730AD|nr:complement resistance protein TraT [Endozoicomonas acroporae]